MARCTITYQKTFSPVLYFINPQVVYNGAEVDFHFDPKNKFIYDDQLEERKPFVNAKIGNALIDFDGYVDENTPVYGHNLNNVRGKVTD